MIVYNDIKRQFVNDVKDNSIADKILGASNKKGFRFLLFWGHWHLLSPLKWGVVRKKGCFTDHLSAPGTKTALNVAGTGSHGC